MNANAVEEYRGVAIYYDPVYISSSLDGPRRYRCTIGQQTYSAMSMPDLKRRIDAAIDQQALFCDASAARIAMRGRCLRCDGDYKLSSDEAKRARRWYAAKNADLPDEIFGICDDCWAAGPDKPRRC